MREAAFVKQNQPRWEEFEQLLQQKNRPHPDRLAELFIQLGDDLSYAQTNYPGSKTTKYLNQMALRVHQMIYKNKKEDRGRFIRFWLNEVPLLYYLHRREMAYSFFIFTLAMAVGIVSTAHDETFTRLILGDSYVNMTLQNIAANDPMAVYKSMRQGDMFLGITFNNIRVSFVAFAMGVLASAGTGYILLTNGIMLGTFQYFFYQKGLLIPSMLSIWIHGTLEISAIILAGASGLVMGNSLLFPGTWPRMVSFKRGAKEGMKMVIGLVPVFIMAGFLESYVTRLTAMHWSFKLGVILLSALFIIFYFIVYPYRKFNHANTGKQN